MRLLVAFFYSNDMLNIIRYSEASELEDKVTIRMEDFEEKRVAERFYLKAPIQYTTPNHKNAQNANMFNCSETGLYFETKSPLKPGNDIVVSGAESEKYFRANIKWCKRVGPKDKTIYGIGAQYYD